jgi:hypothetical protein
MLPGPDLAFAVNESRMADGHGFLCCDRHSMVTIFARLRGLRGPITSLREVSLHQILPAFDWQVLLDGIAADQRHVAPDLGEESLP